MAKEPDPQLVREIARKHILAAINSLGLNWLSMGIGGAIQQESGGGLDVISYTRWANAAHARVATARITVSWPDEQAQAERTISYRDSHDVVGELAPPEHDDTPTGAAEWEGTSRRVSPAFATLAAQLRAERERQGLTQRALARNTEGYSTALCNWERGSSVPGIAALAKWAAGLGLELALVPTGTDVRALLDEREQLAAPCTRAHVPVADTFAERSCPWCTGYRPAAEYDCTCTGWCGHADCGHSETKRWEMLEARAARAEHGFAVWRRQADEVAIERDRLRERAEKAEAELRQLRARLDQIGEVREDWGVRVTYTNGEVFEGPIADAEDTARSVIAKLNDEDRADVISRALITRWRGDWRDAAAAQDGAGQQDGEAGR